MVKIGKYIGFCVYRRFFFYNISRNSGKITVQRCLSGGISRKADLSLVNDHHTAVCFAISARAV